MATGTPSAVQSDAAIRPSARRSQPSSPRNPAPTGISQNISTMSASSSIKDDYRPPSSGSTPLPKEDSKEESVVKKDGDPVIVAAASPNLSSSSLKADRSDDEPMDRGGYSSSAMDKTRQIFGRILGLIPVIFISMTLTYASLYVLKEESFGIQAATFVGVAGFVYSIYAAIYWDLIPSYQVSREKSDGKLLRNCIDLTCTLFTTAAFNTAVLKLSEITSTQGFIFFGVSYGLSYVFLKRYHRNLYKPPTWAQQRAE